MRVYCPHPDCNHMGEAITKVHCRTVHNMERDELFEKYGKPVFVGIDPHKLSKNQQVTNSLINNHKYNKQKKKEGK